MQYSSDVFVKNESRNGYTRYFRHRQVIEDSITTDASDTVGRLTPKFDKEPRFTVDADQFILTCSFDRRHCSFK